MNINHMNVFSTRAVRWALPGLMVGLLSAIQPVQAQLVTPLQIATAEPIINEFGQVIQGDANTPPEERPLVQVLWSDAGSILPPLADGTPHPDTPLVENGETAIGNLVAPSLENPGLFGAAIANPRPNSGQLFVRVFNAPTPQESLFYADSQVMTIDGNKALYGEFGAVTNMIDAMRDTDTDGLPDWWEHLNFGHATAVDDPDKDDDGDGFSIRQEFVAGTDPQDEESRLFVTAVSPLFSENYEEHVWTNNVPGSPEYGMVMTSRTYDVVGHVVEWPSVAGRVYALEYATNFMTGFLPLTNAVDLPPMAGGRNVFTNTQMPDAAPMFYRARVRIAD